MSKKKNVDENAISNGFYLQTDADDSFSETNRTIDSLKTHNRQKSTRVERRRRRINNFNALHTHTRGHIHSHFTYIYEPHAYENGRAAEFDPQWKLHAHTFELCIRTNDVSYISLVFLLFRHQNQFG